jgi:acyl carrier protein
VIPTARRFLLQGISLNVQKEVLNILDEILGLDGRSRAMDRASPLLGAVPELDSMAVVSVITTLEERFGFTVEDDDLDASSFATVGALADFVQMKLAA